jgi:RNA polymerase sigma factor (sigma-70 family)
VRRAIVNEHTSRRRLRSAAEVVTDRLPEAAVPAADAGLATRDALWRAMAELPPRQRAVLVLRYYEDLPDAEIAELIGARQATVRSLASRGAAALRAGVRGVGDSPARSVDDHDWACADNGRDPHDE